MATYYISNKDTNSWAILIKTPWGDVYYSWALDEIYRREDSYGAFFLFHFVFELFPLF